MSVVLFRTLCRQTNSLSFCSRSLTISSRFATMAERKEDVFTQKVARAIANTRSFPHLFESLKRLGVKSYKVDVAAHQRVFTGVRDWDVFVEPVDKTWVPLAIEGNLNTTGVRDAAAGDFPDYASFLRALAKAGCSTYDVSLNERTTVYSGKGGQHIDKFPPFVAAEFGVKIEEITEQSTSEKWQFPRTFEAYKSAGVKSYKVDVSSHKRVYTGLRDGETYEEAVPKDWVSIPVEGDFSTEGVRAALAANRKDPVYMVFLRAIAKAGCTDYEVSMTERAICYCGKNGKYTEQIPAFV